MRGGKSVPEKCRSASCSSSSSDVGIRGVVVARFPELKQSRNKLGTSKINPGGRMQARQYRSGGKGEESLVYFTMPEMIKAAKEAVVKTCEDGEERGWLGPSN